jgi:hypothetical protein
MSQELKNNLNHFAKIISNKPKIQVYKLAYIMDYFE